MSATLSDTGWRRPLHNPLAEMFAPGTEVRHLNPRFADWRGVIAPEPETCRFLRTNDWREIDPSCHEFSTCVYVEWDGRAGHWYDVEAIAPCEVTS